MTEHQTYVIKYNDKYLRFGSYRTARAVENPLQASTFTLQNAQRRLDRVSQKYNNIYYVISGVDIRVGLLELVLLTVEVTDERIIP